MKSSLSVSVTQRERLSCALLNKPVELDTFERTYHRAKVPEGDGPDVTKWTVKVYNQKLCEICYQHMYNM